MDHRKNRDFSASDFNNIKHILISCLACELRAELHSSNDPHLNRKITEAHKLAIANTNQLRIQDFLLDD